MSWPSTSILRQNQSKEDEKLNIIPIVSWENSNLHREYTEKVLNNITNLSKNENSNENFKVNNLLSEGLKNDQVTLITIDEISVENSAKSGSHNSTAHFIKYFNKNGKIVKIWECGICARRFQHQYTLMRHLPTHTNIRNFVCNECGKAFRQLSTLSQHKAIHSIERPYSCETCKKSFNRVSTLISHRKTHSDVKPFRCHMCNKGFHQKGNLRNHIYIHTNERPYRCSICSKGFNQMSNLVCHTQKIHSEECESIWNCHRCNMRFSKRALLRAHELQTHQIQSGSVRRTKSKAVYSKKNIMRIPDNATSNEQTDVAVSQSQITQNGIVIEAIETDAMKTAKANNEIPFAVLHFIEGLPLLVRIIDYNKQSLLRPANSEDFAILCRQKRNPNEKISIAVVAAVYQTLNLSGRPEFTIMPPKNIYKFTNTQQMLTVDIDKTPVLTPSSYIETISTPPVGPSSELDIPSLFINLETMKKESLNNKDLYFDSIVEHPNPPNIIQPDNRESPKAIAIVEDNSHWLKRDRTNNIEDNETFSQAIQNIATGNLLTPKKSIKTNDKTPERKKGYKLQNNPAYLSQSTGSSTNQIENRDVVPFNNFFNTPPNDEMDINVLRNLMSDKLLNDFENYITDFLQN